MPILLVAGTILLICTALKLYLKAHSRFSLLLGMLFFELLNNSTLFIVTIL